mgnify:CR=1 FL=1
MSQLKRDLHHYCQQFVAERIAAIELAIAAARASSNDDTKSSAGDKYETGRAMAQLEIDKNTTQLLEAQQLQQVLNKINPELQLDKVMSGSLVKTPGMTFYISIPAGKIELAGTTYYAISPASPIGKALMGKQKGEEVVFNSKLMMIEELS